ncbi:armadillo-type protein [Dunaliella salina]|uniref:Armadillo-type protein n=1 Tax=Dunaliella salina TaxID=3046 RepID=A0ABQ7FUK2_DUNSA|nr:armadillo-type protein [Dunaliella salina]|eukprot:KAF5826060.1 armadillo-type protein [Dunaliella salina]
MGLKLMQEASNVVSDSLDILAEVTQKFGNLLVAEHARIKATLVPLLDDARAPIRKRAMHCLAAMSVYMNDGLLDEVVSHLLQRLKEGQKVIKPDVLRSYVAAVGHVSRSVGYRFGKYLGEATALVVSYCEAAKEKEGDDELREHCLQAMEGFVLCCPTDARSHMGALIDAGLKFIKFDPNFAGENMDEDGAEEEGGEEDEEQEEEEEEAYSDDEDVSWKVRRAAAKLISAVASQYPDAVAEVYKRTSGELINRFREREENVKGDVFAAYIVLARQVGNVSRRFRPEDPNNPVQLLHADVPAVVRSCAKQLKEKNPKTRMAVFGLLRELIGVAPVPVAQELPLLVPGITAALSLCRVAPVPVAQELPLLVPGTTATLGVGIRLHYVRVKLCGVAPVPVAQELPLLVPGITAALSASCETVSELGCNMHLSNCVILPLPAPVITAALSHARVKLGGEAPIPVA